MIVHTTWTKIDAILMAMVAGYCLVNPTIAFIISAAKGIRSLHSQKKKIWIAAKKPKMIPPTMEPKD